MMTQSSFVAAQRSMLTALQHSFREHADQVRLLQLRAQDGILPDVAATQELSEADVKWLEDYVDDHGVLLLLAFSYRDYTVL